MVGDTTMQSMEERKPKISVIMGIYNRHEEGQLDEAIESVLRQSFSDFELLLYNDGSGQEVTEHLRDYARRDPRVILIENSENHGLAYSLNTCIKAARGKYLARMDDDDICMPNRLAVQYEFMESHPEYVYVGSNACLLDENGVWGVRCMPECPKQSDFLKYSPFIHPTVMLRSDIFLEQDAYSVEKSTWRCEDYELFMRLWSLGYQGFNIQQELLYYRENRQAYKKRKLRYRIDEMKLRARNFSQLDMLFPFGWLYVLRPLAAALIPSPVILYCKKIYHIRDRAHEQRQGKAFETLPARLAEGTKGFQHFEGAKDLQRYFN